MLKIINLTKNYKSTKAVDNLSLEIKKGEIYGFVGPNGAGKSTTIRSIMNLLNIDAGEIYIKDNKITRESFEKIAPIIGYVPSEINLYDDLTVDKILDYNENFYQKNMKSKRKYLLKEFRLEGTKKIEELSLGNKKKLGIILALVHDPELIILDEPTSGLDPIMQEKLFEILLDEKKKGKTIFYSTHNLTEIKKICDRVGIIKEGKLVDNLTMEELKNNKLEIVSLRSPHLEEIKKLLKGKIVEETETTIKIMTEMNVNSIIKILSKYNIEKVLIEDPNIEDVFMHYYE